MGLSPPFKAKNASQEPVSPPWTGTKAMTTETSYSLYTTQASRSSTPPYKSESFLPPKAYNRLGFFRRNIGLWRAIPCALAAIFWAAQMIYFFFYFITRPPLEDGSWPRISPTYAMWPYISCIGGVRSFSFRSVSITVACLLYIGFGIDLFVGSRSPVGIWWRRGKFITAAISNVFLIALTYANTSKSHRLHLILASFQIFTMGQSKTCDWNLARNLRERTPNNKFLKRSKMWKRVAVTPAIPCGFLTLAAMYGCTPKVENGSAAFTPVCWSLTSFGAPAEWLLSWCWVLFLLTISYDSYHLEYTVDLLLSTPPPLQKKSHGLAFWRRWTRKDTSFKKKMEDWNTSKNSLVGGAGSFATERSVGQPEGQGPTGGGFGEEIEEEDISGRRYDSDAEYAWLPPSMPQSVFGPGKYQKLGDSPRVGEPIDLR